MTASFLTAKEPSNYSSTAACSKSNHPDAEQINRSERHELRRKHADGPAVDTDLSVAESKNDNLRNSSPPRNTHDHATQVEEVRDSEICVAQSQNQKTVESTNASVVVGFISRLYLQNQMMALCDDVDDHPVYDLSLELIETSLHREADAAQNSSVSRESGNYNCFQTFKVSLITKLYYLIMKIIFGSSPSLHSTHT